MNTIVPWLIFTLIGVILVWVGYSIFFHLWESQHGYALNGSGRDVHGPDGGFIRTHRQEGALIKSGNPGDARVCPVCAAKLMPGERVQSSAFPGLPGQGRMMHIFGCVYCLNGGRERKCPVCGDVIDVEEILVARMFEQPGRSHVHVLGCSHCREVLATVKKNR
jgi:hypothetical protein